MSINKQLEDMSKSLAPKLTEIGIAGPGRQKMTEVQTRKVINLVFEEMNRQLDTYKYLHIPDMCTVNNYFRKKEGQHFLHLKSIQK